MSRLLRSLPFGAAILLATAGCASLGPDRDAASATVAAFATALAQQDGAQSCALLAPATVEDLEQAAGTGCAEAVTTLGLPDAADDPQVRAYGRQAQVRTDSDVVFLTRSGDRWLITAAGCEARPDRPYDCAIEGS